VFSTSWEQVIGKGSIRADENIIFQGHAVPNLDSTLHRDRVPNLYIILDKDPVTNIAVGPDNRSGKNVRKSPNPGSLADMGGLANAFRVKIEIHRYLLN
jgi:hypothetical protein